jgi:hypothetical protein
LLLDVDSLPILESALIEYFDPPLNRQIIVYIDGKGKGGKGG